MLLAITHNCTFVLVAGTENRFSMLRELRFLSVGDENIFASPPRAGTEPVPTRIVAKLRMEKKGRGGKTVTVVYGLPRNAAFLKSLCGELKRSCGTGGAVLDDGVEVQGELRARVRDVLEKKGYLVTG